MPTVVSVTVEATGGNYTTIQGAIDGLSTHCTSTDLRSGSGGDEIYEIGVEAGTYDETLIIDETTGTDADHYIIIKPLADTDRHDGTSGSGVIVEPTSGSGATLTILDAFTRIEGLELRADAGSGRKIVTVGNSSHTAEGSRIEKCLIWGNGNSSFTTSGVHCQEWNTGTSSNPILIRDCVIWECDQAGVFPQNSRAWADLDHYFKVINCDFFDNNRHIGYRVARSTSELVIKVLNCTGANHLSGDFDTVGSTVGTVTTTGSDKNYSEDGGASTDFPGSDGTAYTLSDSASPGAGDWILVTDDGSTPADFNALKLDNANNDILDLGTGTTDSDVSATDILYEARGSSTCDPGAFQVTSVSSGVTVSGTAAAPAAEATGSIQLGRSVSGTASTGSASATGSIQIGRLVSGTASTGSAGATGALQVGRRISGTASTGAATASGSITVTPQDVISVSGVATTGAAGASGSILVETPVVVSISGTAETAAATAAGSVTVTSAPGTISISGTATVAAATATGAINFGLGISGTAEAPAAHAMGTISVNGDPLYAASPVAGKTWADLSMEAWLLSRWSSRARWQNPDA